MKLKHFNAGNTLHSRRASDNIRINSKTGIIAFNEQVCNNLTLEKDTRIEFLQDEEHPQNWYILLSNSEEAFRCRTFPNDKKLNGRAVICSRYLTKKILESLNIQEESAHFIVAKEPIQVGMFAIITESYYTSKK